MGKISYNGGPNMAMITCDMIISREPVNYLQYQFQFSARIGKTNMTR